MYRPQLNGYFPIALIQKEYRKHLVPSLTVGSEAYASNQDVEDLLNNLTLMKNIRHAISEADEELNMLRQTALLDEDISTRRFSRPSKERDYE